MFSSLILYEALNASVNSVTKEHCLQLLEAMKITKMFTHTDMRVVY